MTLELIGKPGVEKEYSGEYETTMVCELRRDDGVVGDVWIVAGVPGHLRGTSDAARTQYGYQDVWVYGDCPDYWLSGSLMPDEEDRENQERELAQIHDAVLLACRVAALQTHEAELDRLANQ